MYTDMKIKEKLKFVNSQHLVLLTNFPHDQPIDK